ncbi:17871_t:CDS:2, partial [Entrophospora sp. SA101]
LFDLENKGVGLNHDFNHWKFNSSMFSQGVMPLSFTPKPSKYANALFEEMSGYWMDLKPKDDVSTVVDIATWMQMIESEEFIESINTFVSDNQIMFVPKMIKDLPFIKNRVEKLLANNYMFYGRLKNIVIKRRKELEKNINNDNDYLKTKQLDLLTSLIVVNTPYDTRPQKNVNPALLRPMTDDEIRGVMFDAFVAGTDTTVNTFCFVVYYISHYPEVKKKLFEEIDSVFKDDPTREVTTTDLEKLKYCEAIIKETSRIRPTVSMLSRYTPLKLVTSTITICKDLKVKLTPRELTTRA